MAALRPGLESKQADTGESEDLYEFLFGSERASLEPYAEILRGVQSGACFYCARGLGPDSGQVDHFVPWSRYPVDLAHNFVLAHAGCNDSKSNLLASVEHLERWCIRNVDRERVLADAFAERRLGVCAADRPWRQCELGARSVRPREPRATTRRHLGVGRGRRGAG